MKPLLERAARGLCALDGHPLDATMEGKPIWVDYLAEARTVLAEVREPGADLVSQLDPSGAANAAEVWRKMIDVALAEN